MSKHPDAHTAETGSQSQRRAQELRVIYDAAMLAQDYALAFEILKTIWKVEDGYSTSRLDTL